ncbi:glycosyltransferase family A protein [Thiohalophilus sp.]|uniref:glycosyltransferase family A protein n=1 Tax=Thiohalophilus sp. TaxID=3028392 RepID=UPI002ACDED8C|nr:glycosyltransferase family A protein [Thiohalophilus sp.]MDZ7804402.1 glycosyltransferase family A protein [Thiohalophilus sp.]
MTKTPFFSILIPTKPFTPGEVFAIGSVLQQDFDDCEVVVCDNDDGHETEMVVDQFKDDKRIKYLRTGGLDMVDNWNYALEHSTGKYITVLEDKMVFYPNALTELKKKF